MLIDRTAWHVSDYNAVCSKAHIHARGPGSQDSPHRRPWPPLDPKSVGFFAQHDVHGKDPQIIRKSIERVKGNVRKSRGGLRSALDQSGPRPLQGTA